MFGEAPLNCDRLTAENLLGMLQYLVCYVTRTSLNKYQEQLENFNYDQFCAKNASNVYYLRTLSIVYFDCETVRRFNSSLRNLTKVDAAIRDVLAALGLLYGLFRLEPNLSLLYEANFFQPVHQNALTIIREKILLLCGELKKEMVSLIDVFAPPDFILNSSLGYSDGRIYEHIFDALSKHRNSFERADWYKDFTENKPALKRPPLHNSKL